MAFKQIFGENWVIIYCSVIFWTGQQPFLYLRFVSQHAVCRYVLPFFFKLNPQSALTLPTVPSPAFLFPSCIMGIYIIWAYYSLVFVENTLQNSSSTNSLWKHTSISKTFFSESCFNSHRALYHKAQSSASSQHAAAGPYACQCSIYSRFNRTKSIKTCVTKTLPKLLLSCWPDKANILLKTVAVCLIQTCCTKANV